jgi:16S rRNA (cytosine967-C5)-methyltransferase
VVEGQSGSIVPELIARGELTPQSRGSAAVVEALDPQPGEHVLDLCAGPGIKTGQIAARMGDRGEVISIESDPDRAAEVAAQARRLGLRSVTVIEADATGPGMGPNFDRVLLDAPCSDLGALASRPDARWRKSPATVERLVEVQAGLLQKAKEALRPGGTLVYSTCTISSRENEGQVDGGEQFQLRPDRDRTTGFFICRLKRDDGPDD